MATQVVALTGFRKPMNKKVMQEASYGERGNTLSRSQCPVSHNKRIENCRSLEGGSRSSRAGDVKKSMEGKLQRQRRGELKRVLHRFGLLFLASSIDYLLKKAKELYHGVVGDGFNHRRMEIEASLVDAYFSIPVAYPTTSTVPCAA
ncbi:hypothetical protein Vadar_022500 [Vaccinium darrowii]|uniref:Uncharacterized protein n=1 Tax=Vaccinium darrowii TaxID=229202 RepID=A0ACB7X2R9_9ERIC|nr:hypothetical protein Vadar_022500 [Vaccinium darrowii]